MLFLLSCWMSYDTPTTIRPPHSYHFESISFQGARGLRGIFEKLLTAAMFTVPEHPECHTVMVDAPAARGDRRVLLLKGDLTAEEYLRQYGNEKNDRKSNSFSKPKSAPVSASSTASASNPLLTALPLKVFRTRGSAANATSLTVKCPKLRRQAQAGNAEINEENSQIKELEQGIITGVHSDIIVADDKFCIDFTVLK